MIHFSDPAKKKVHEFIQSSGGTAALRVTIKSKTEKGFVYDFQLEDYHAERPNDVIVREGGFATRLDPETAKFIRGSTVDWVEKDSVVGFAVQNPNNPIPAAGEEELHSQLVEIIKTIFDPEIPVNIYELGLIYNIGIDEEKNVTIKMTLTAPNCPAAEQLPLEVENKCKSVQGVKDAKINLVWEPPWNKDMMSEAAKLQLGIN